MNFVKKHKVTIANFFLIIVINLIAYKFLPDTIYTQISTSGKPSNLMSKEIFIFFTPFVLLLLSAILNLRNSFMKSPYVINIICFLLNLLIIVINLM